MNPFETQAVARAGKVADSEATSSRKRAAVSPTSTTSRRRDAYASAAARSVAVARARRRGTRRIRFQVEGECPAIELPCDSRPQTERAKR